MKSVILVLCGFAILVVIFLLSKPKNLSSNIIKSNNSFLWDENNIDGFKNFTSTYLDKMIKRNEGGEFLILSFNNEYFIQFMVFDDDNSLLCEGVSNKFLSSKNELKKKEIEYMIQLGFTKPGTKDRWGNKSPNFSKFYPSSDSKKIIQELILMLKNTYHITKGMVINYEVGK